MNAVLDLPVGQSKRTLYFEKLFVFKSHYWEQIKIVIIIRTKTEKCCELWQWLRHDDNGHCKSPPAVYMISLEYNRHSP